MKILLIDNYDSFTYNVYQYLLELEHEVLVVRNDKITIEEIKSLNPDAIFLSPGPKTPKEAGICLMVIKEFAGKISIFGICLGHQSIGEAFGGVVIHAKQLMHGKTSKIIPFNKGVMKEFNEPFIATRYHSLIIEKETLPDCLEITCESEDGQIMGVVHKEYNIEGVQFHPESIMTESGKKILDAFLKRTEKLIKSDNKFEDYSGKVFKLQKEDKINTSKEINIHQYITEVNIKEEPFKVFKKLQSHFGSNKCFLLESASGPKIDCTKTTVGLFPEFEILLTGSNMTVKSSNDKWKTYLYEILKKQYSLNDGVFYIGEDKFSKIFKLLSESIKLIKNHNKNLVISNGLTGYFSYEYLHRIENVPKHKNNVLGLPEVHLKYFPILLEMEFDKKKALIVENDLNDIKNSLINEVVKVIDTESEIYKEKEITNNEIPKELMKSNITKEEYYKRVKTAKKYIYEGDIFQVQLGQRVCIDKDINSVDLYETLKRINPSPYMFYWDNEDYQLMGDSPELQLRVDNGKIMIRPIAGTSKGKGTDEKSRNEILEKFTKDSKENAEHIMLVDLARNDIGCKAVKGSVHVSQLMKVEEFSHVFHLTSTVVGQLKEGLNSMEVFESTFPAGTLSGAPKVRAMEIISELETEIRGPYGGAFGFFDFDGNIVTSIIIRTILRKDKKLYIHASAGIVADSVPESEWNETLHKMAGLRQAISNNL
ncbi:MAG: chorismate-binding protein [Bacillota bacterium]|nr:chorismate-binding protein [Bacillota bacterium]